MPTCGEAAIGLLEELGVEVVFGIPGVHTLEFYRGLATSRIRHISPRHEQGAALMATGYAMASGSPGVCLLITGAGLTNAATGIASAHHDSQPLLVLSSATATADARRGHGALHDLPDQQAFMQAITGFARTIDDPAALPEALAQADAQLRDGRPRPAFVGVPIDVLARECGPLRMPRRQPVRPSEPGAADLARAAKLLADATRPILLLGGGAADAGEQALRVSAASGAPIVTTVNGKGAVPERHPASLGATATLEPVYTALTRADVVLAAGTEFSEVDYYYAEGVPRLGGRVIRVDIDPDQLGGRVAAEVELCGDTTAVLRALADRMGTTTRAAVAAERAAALRAGLRFGDEASALFPVLDAIAAALPDDVVIASDSTQLAYAANNYLPVQRPRSYLCPAGFGTLGPALPMAIGAKVAAPERPVVCLIGDGGMLFTIAELATAAELGLPMAILLWQNHGYGEIRDAMDTAHIPHQGTDASAHDHLQIAAGFGCHAIRVTHNSALGDAIHDAFQADRPTVIELPAGLLSGT